MKAGVPGSGAAESIPVVAGEWVCAAGLERGAQDVGDHEGKVCGWDR